MNYDTSDFNCLNPPDVKVFDGRVYNCFNQLHQDHSTPIDLLHTSE